MKVKCVKLAPGADMNKHTNTTTNQSFWINFHLIKTNPFPTFVQSQFINQMRSVMTLAKCKTSVIPRTLIKRFLKCFPLFAKFTPTLISHALFKNNHTNIFHIPEFIQTSTFFNLNGFACLPEIPADNRSYLRIFGWLLHTDLKLPKIERKIKEIAYPTEAFLW